MERRLLALMGATLVVAACGGPEDGSTLQSEFQVAAVEEPDGRVSLYSGRLIADALARGEDLESPSFMTSFLRVRVPRSLLDTVRTDPRQPVVISLEQAYPGVEILLHERGDPSGMKNTKLTPADPWLTGHAQVRYDFPSRLFVGGAHIVKYSGTLPLGVAEISWGMTSCTGQPGCPPLRYENPNPCLWPLPLPTSWLLTPLQDAPQTIEALCHDM